MSTMRKSDHGWYAVNLVILTALTLFLLFAGIRLFKPVSIPTSAPAPTRTTDPAAGTPTTAPVVTDDTESEYQLFSETFKMKEATHTALLLLLFGALGASAVSLKVLVYHAGREEYRGAWAGYYVMRPIEGASLALGFVFVLKAGLSGPVMTSTTEYGPAGLAFLIGCFSREAMAKLKQVFETIFTPAPSAGGTPAPTDFKIAISPRMLDLTQAGASRAATVTVTPVSGSLGSASLSIPDDSQGAVTVSPQGPQAVPAAGLVFNLTVDPAKLATNLKTFTIDVVSGTQKRSDQLIVSK